MIGNGEKLVKSKDALATNALPLLRCFHTLKGMSATMDYSSLTLLSHALEDVCDGLAQARLPADDATAEVLGAGLDALRRQVAVVEAGGEPEQDVEMERRVRDHLQAGGTTAFRLLVPSVDEISADSGGSASLPCQTEDAAGAFAEMLSACGRLRTLVGDAPELLTEVTRIQEAARQMYARLAELRQVPFGTSIPPLRRHLRGVCREHGREAALEVQGEDIAVDPDVLGPLQGALVQLLTNAVIHGIEPPAERESAFKPPTGRLRLRLERVGSWLRMQFTDDGRGLDTERLRRATGEEHGDPVDLALRAGVSTAPRLDLLAGRGLGLPSVVHAVDQLGGTVVITSHPGRGMSVAIDVPLHADLLEVLLVEVDHHALGILAHQAKPSGEDRTDAPTLLGLPVTGAAALILQGGAYVRVDNVLGWVQAIVRPPPFPLSRLPGVVGTTVAPDGSILFLVDPVEQRGA